VTGLGTGPRRTWWLSSTGAYTTLGVVTLVAVWWLVSVIGFSRTGFVPTPLSVLVRFAGNLGDPVYWHAIAVTALEAGKGYLWGNVLAFAVAVVVLLVPWLEGIATQTAVIASCSPLTAIAPLVVLMSDTSSRAASSFLAAMMVFYTTVIGSILGFKAADPTALEVVQAYGGGRWKRLAKVRLIAAIPNIMAALRIAAPAAFTGAVLGEFFLSGVDSGLGIMLMAAQVAIQPQALWALTLLCAAVAGIGYAVVSGIAVVLTAWARGVPLRGGRK
jgi:ABC-type nitrate/sulfonate/bicarbonate transport system permease component